MSLAVRLFAAGSGIAEVAREVHAPKTTVTYWRKQWAEANAAKPPKIITPRAYHRGLLWLGVRSYL
jgi:transposase-like protein